MNHEDMTSEQIAESNAKTRPERVLRMAGCAFDVYQALLSHENQLVQMSINNLMDTIAHMFGPGECEGVKDDLLDFAKANDIKVEAFSIPVETLMAKPN